MPENKDKKAPPPARRPAPRPRRTVDPEISVPSFDQIRQEVRANRERVGDKAQQAEETRKEELLESVSDLSVNGIVQKIATLEVDLGNGLSEISRQLIEQVRLLADVREAVAIERKELETLYKIEVVASTLDALVREYETKKDAFETGILKQNALWEEQKQSREKEQKEFDLNLKKQRAREQEEFEYQRELERRISKDQFTQKTQQVERELSAKREQLEKGWDVREKELAAREAEVGSLQNEVASFPEELKNEIAAAVNKTKSELDQQHKQDLLIFQKDRESETKIADLRIRSLEDTVLRQMSQIEVLQQRVEEAKKQVQDIAVRAIESTSGSKALTHVSQIAMEQARPRPQP